MSIILNKYVGGIPTEALGNSLQMCEVVPVQTNTEDHMFLMAIIVWLLITVGV